jgi:hypothetical protein
MEEHTMIDPDVRRALDGTSIAHLATVLADGSPHVVPVFVGTHGDAIAVFTGPQSLSIAPEDNPFVPIAIRGTVVEWLEGDAAWEIIDRIAMTYTGSPYSRDLDRVVALIAPERQIVGVR